MLYIVEFMIYNLRFAIYRVSQKKVRVISWEILLKLHSFHICEILIVLPVENCPILFKSDIKCLRFFKNKNRWWLGDFVNIGASCFVVVKIHFKKLFNPFRYRGAFSSPLILLNKYVLILLLFNLVYKTTFGRY